MAEPPGHSHYRQQYVRCGKAGCKHCATGPGHGPYWYATWREGTRTRTRYIGKHLPGGLAAEDLDAPPVEPTAPVPPRRAVRTRSAAVRAPRAVTALPGSTPRLRIWILGRFSVESAGAMVPESAWRRQSGAVLLKLLLLADFRRLPREHISSHLWPDADTDTARSQLASAVHVLRRALEPGLVKGTPSRYLRHEGANLVLRLGAEDWVDYLAFESALGAAASAADPLLLLEQAAALYGGDLMPEEGNSWCVAAREGLRLRWHGMLLALADAQAAHRQFDSAAATLTQLLTTDPSLEEAARRLMGLLGRQGRRSEALRLYEHLRTSLHEDLGAEPSAETEALAEALRTGTAPRQRQTRRSDPAARESAGQLIPALVGRIHEMDQVRAAMQAARDGRGQILLLTGAAGIGKSRIADEAATYATVLGFTVLWGRAAESEQGLPYAPIAEALRSYIQTRPPGALRRDLAGAEAVRSIVPEVVAIVPSLAEPAPLEHPGAERLRLWMAVRTLLTAATERHPLLLILEDLHWADTESLGLLTFLTRRCRELRQVLLATMQGDALPEDHPLFLLMREGRREGTLTLVPVTGLSSEEGGELALQQLGADLSPAQATVLHDQCGGNPLFITELLALLREPARTGNDDLLAAVVAGTATQPATILLTLRHRLEYCSPACRALLRIAAVIGERFPRALLARVAGLEPDAFAHALDEAVERGLLQEDTDGRTGGYRLAHSSLNRVLYEELQPTHLPRLHAQIGAGLVEAVSLDSAPDIAAITHHYLLSGDRLAAAGWLERAGDRAAGLHAWADARAQYDKACDLLGQVAAIPDADMDGTRRILARLSEKLGDLLLLEGEYAAAQMQFARARVMVQESAPRAELWRKEGVAWGKQGDFARALEALSAAEHDGASPYEAGGEGLDGGRKLPVELQAELELSRGDVYWNQEAFEAAAEAVERALPVLHDQPEGSALARATYLLGHAAELRGDYQQAEGCYERSLAIRERIGDQQGMGACWYGLGMVAYDRGDLARAEQCHQRALVIRERIGDQWGVAFSWGKLAQVAQYQGQYARAEACNRRDRNLREQIGNQPGSLNSPYKSSQVAHERGEYAEATGYLEHALRIQERVGDQWGCSNTLSDLGDVTRDRGDFGMAEEYVRRSLVLKEHLGDQLGIAGCLHSLGLLACEQGDLGTATLLGRRARHLARRIGTHGMEAMAALGQASTAIRAGRLRLAMALIAHSHRLADYTSVRTAVQAALATAALLSAQDHLPEAAAVAREAIQLAMRNQFRREEALGQRVLAQCLLAMGDPITAVVLLRGACLLLAGIGSAVELARTQVALASALEMAVGKEEHAVSQAEGTTLRVAALACLAERGAYVV